MEWTARHARKSLGSGDLHPADEQKLIAHSVYRGVSLVASIVSIRNPEALEQAASLMRDGQLVIVPTDSIYGIATVMTGEATIEHMYEVRGRTREPALPFLLAETAEIARLTRPSNAALRLARKFWPGSLTLILPPAADLPAYARAFPIAVRVPDYRPLTPLLRMLGGYALVTGAVRSGYPPAITVQEAVDLFEDDVPLILDGGQALYGIPSTIVDCVSDPPVIVRRGPIPENSVWQALGLTSSTASVSDL